MNADETVIHIGKKYNLDLNQESPIPIDIGRLKDIPRLFNELGFKVGAEVGVYLGFYARWLLRMMPGLKLYGIDSWIPYKGYEDITDNNIIQAYEKAKEMTKGYDCTLIKGWSNEVVDQFEDESLDFVFIDGNHDYEYVIEDIAKWSKKVRPGGIVYGHDFDDRWGVARAVTEWTQTYKISPWFFTTQHRGRCWLYVKS